MTRCIEFYEKVEQDGNFCGMSPSTVTEVNQYMAFMKEHGFDMSKLSERAAKPLIHEQDGEVKWEGIKNVKKAIEEGNMLTWKRVNHVLEKVRRGLGKPTKEEMSRHKHPFTYRPLQPQGSDSSKEADNVETGRAKKKITLEGKQRLYDYFVGNIKALLEKGWTKEVVGVEMEKALRDTFGYIGMWKINEVLSYEYFIKEHPNLKHLSMESAQVLMDEKDPKVLADAIESTGMQLKQSAEERENHKRLKPGEYAKNLEKSMGGKQV